MLCFIYRRKKICITLVKIRRKSGNWIKRYSKKSCHGPGSVRARAPLLVSARVGLPISHCQRVDLEPTARCSLVACWETTYCNVTLCTGHIVHALHRRRTCLAFKFLSITRHVRTVGGWQAGRAEDSSGWGAGGRGAPPAGCLSSFIGQQQDS